MKCPKCDQEMVETESWGLREHVCPKCGNSFPATSPSPASSETGEFGKPKPKNGSSS